MTDKPALLLPRPQAASDRFLSDISDLLPHLGEVVISPALSIEPLGEPLDPASYDAVLFSSAHAVDRVMGQVGQRAYCVGDATAARAKAAGFEVLNAQGNGDNLIALVRTTDPTQRILFPRGRHISTDFRAELVALGFSVDEAIVYDQVAQDPSPAAQYMLAGTGPVVLPLLSPRTATIVARWAKDSAADIMAFALSPAIASEWGGPAIISKRPDQAALVAAIAKYLKIRGNG